MLRFKDYEFRRVKTSGNQIIAYTKIDWVDKEVIIIPVPINITDRWIEKHYNNEAEEYQIIIESDQVMKKTVRKASNIGKLYIPKEYLGLDVLIIEAPVIKDLY